METWDAIRSRKNVRSYDGRPIGDADLNRILEAARRTPSSRNRQRWDLVVVTGEDRLTDLARVWKGAGHVPGSAATIAVIAPADPEQRESVQYDLGQLTMSIMLAATDLGIGTAHASVGDQALAREILGFPGDRFCAWLIALGHPTTPLRPIERPDRRPLEDVVHRDRW